MSGAGNNKSIITLLKRRNGLRCFDNLKEILEHVVRTNPDVILIDDSVFEKIYFNNLIVSLLRTPAEVRIIVYTGSINTEYIKSLSNNGIRGIVHKASPKKKVVEAIKLVSVGGVYIDNHFNFIAFKNDLNSKILKDAVTGLLSKQERKVLELIFEGFENKAIAGKLELSIKTVETYKERIKEKIGVTSVKDIYKLNE